MTTGLLDSATAGPLAPIPLWPGKAPGETEQLGEERDMTKPKDGLIAGKPVIRLGNVSNPTITFYKAPAEKNSGTAILVCPGGGYSILAMDLEGTEICQWLNSVGVNAVLLKYRVPKRTGEEKHFAPLQDPQRAMSLMRKNAKAWGFEAERIGVLGFSAGAHLSAALCSTNARTYEAVDGADKLETQPNFAVLIYPGGLVVKDHDDAIPPEVAVNPNTPPTFLAMAANDPVRVENALYYAMALKKAKVPVELHIYPTGGHGYGLRRTKDAVTTWPDRVADWLQGQGFLRKP
jgi:acetyl esterase/lipase